jgi:hypothetical protein
MLHRTTDMPARVRSIVLALTIAFAACNSARANEPNSPAVAPPGKHDVHSFVPAGMKVVESARGDLTGAGHSDALLVISPPSSANEKLGEGAPRAVLLLTQDAAGSLQKVAENRRIVPCARCGGLAGDPYAFSRIEKGQFTISISGGSRERWADDYTFRYAADRNTWFLYKVTRELTDTQTEQHKALELTPKDFGQIAFADFDPTELPRIEPPTEHRSTETN